MKAISGSIKELLMGLGIHLRDRNAAGLDRWECPDEKHEVGSRLGVQDLRIGPVGFVCVL